VTNWSNARLSRLFGAGRCSGPPFPLRSVSRSAGFALVAVIWTVGLITLLGMAVIVGARYRTKVASSYASVLAAGTAAESAINLAIATALTRTGEQNVKFPLRCRMPGGERVIVTVEEETGKVDLNTATAAVLARFFTALSRDQSIGARIAEYLAVAVTNTASGVPHSHGAGYAHSVVGAPLRQARPRARQRCRQVRTWTP